MVKINPRSRNFEGKVEIVISYLEGKKELEWMKTTAENQIKIWFSFLKYLTEFWVHKHWALNSKKKALKKV